MANLIERVKVTAGRLVTVWNTLKKGNENIGYVAIWVEDANGKNERCLLFTEKEIKKAEERALKNKEDIPKKNFFKNLFD